MRLKEEEETELWLLQQLEEEKLKDKTAKKERILIADDNRTIRLLVRANLEIAGYEVIEAENGKEAFEKSLEEKPDLVLLDVIMPEIDGFKVLDLLKGEEKTSDIPVVMLTSLGQERSQILGWKSGVEEYIVKPFNPVAAVEVVNRVLGLKGESKEVRKRAKIERLKILDSFKEEEN